MTGVDEPTNAASELARRVRTLGREGAWEQVAELLVPDARLVPAGGAEDAPLQSLDADAARRVGLVSEESRVLAVRDDHLALLHWADAHDTPTPDRRFGLVETDDQGRLATVTTFDWTVDALTEAADLLDERWRQTTVRDDVDVIVSDGIRGWRRGDQPLLRSLLHESFVAADHRAFSWGDFDKNAFISLFDGNQRNVVVEIAGTYLGATADARAYQLAAWGCGEGGLIEAMVGHFVSVVRGDQMLHTAAYDLGPPAQTIERMRALVDELAAG